jgi:hypothetical protein
MVFSRQATLALALAATFSIGACAAPSDDGEDEADQTEDAIIGGVETFANPAVGVTTLNGSTGCSATLVSPNVVALAGHCFEAGQTSIAPWQFEIRRSSNRNDWYRYDTREGYVPLARNAGPEDIALLRLAQSVPASVATPIPIATRWPSYGTWLKVVGFGCTNRDGSGVGAGVKRTANLRYTPTWDLGFNSRVSCPGDSGGALLGHGPVLLGNISGWGRGGYDHFGDMVKYRAMLQRQIDAWR